MAIDPLLAQSAFDPETTAILARAFDAAWEAVERSSSTVAANAQSKREELAKCIIAAAQDGERDPNRLIERALSQVSLEMKAPASSADDSSA